MNQEYKVHLSQGQKAKLAKAIKDGSALKLRLGKNALSGNDELLLSPRQIAKLQKAKRNNSGVEISFSKSSIRKSVKHGGSLWTSLFSLGTKALPFVTKGVSKVAPHLATGALSALGSLGIDKIFGSGMQGGMILPDAIVKMLQKGIEIPVKFLVNLINMKEMLTRLNLLQKYLEAAYKLLEKLGEKGCKLLEKLEQACRFRRSLFYGNLPPSMVHGRGRDAERREKDFREADFYWGTTAHSTTSPFWEQFFKGKTKMERYSPVKF